MWKDNKLVIFYTNDLHKTPSKHILDSRVKVEYDEGMLCCNGMGKVDRWQGDENLHRSELDVPVIVCAYNMFMNSVDRMDQKRSTNPCRRKEMKLHMTLWTYYLDLAVIQGYAIFQVINPSSRITLQDFKRDLCEEMVSEYREVRKRKKEMRTEVMSLENVMGSIGNDHCLVETIGKKQGWCYLCLQRGIKAKSIYGCTMCKKIFHVNCYTAVHCQGALKGDTKTIMQMIMADETKEPRGKLKKSKFIGEVSDLKLYQEKE